MKIKEEIMTLTKTDFVKILSFSTLDTNDQIKFQLRDGSEKIINKMYISEWNEEKVIFYTDSSCQKTDTILFSEVINLESLKAED